MPIVDDQRIVTVEKNGRLLHRTGLSQYPRNVQSHEFRSGVDAKAFV
jgi:hypothetical protein